MNGEPLTKDYVKRAVAYAWKGCEPAYHMDIDKLVAALNDPELSYPVENYEWGDE